MRLTFLFFGLFFLLTGYSQQLEYDNMLTGYYKNTVPTIQPAELYKRMLKGEKIHLLDTRMKKEFEVSTIKGANHVGFLSFNAKKIEAVKKDELIIVYCTIGARSESVGEKIQKQGYSNVYNLYGGIIQWVNSGYPIYDNTEKKTENVHVYSKDWGVWLKKGTAVY